MTSKKQRKVPELRFRGFTDDWEQRKLSQLLVERNDQHPENGEYPLMSFTGPDGVTPKSERYDRSALVTTTNKKYKRTELNDLIYSSNNLDTGSIGLNKTGKASISPVYSVFSETMLAVPSFVGVLILNKEFINNMIRYRQGVMYGQWRIHERDFLSIHVRVPVMQEQKHIGGFFSALDATIALHQRKQSLLKKLKQGYLQKLFPQKGQRQPELRFSGFTDDWEQRKLGRLVDTVRSYPLSRDVETSSETGYRYIHYGDIHTGVADKISDWRVLPSIRKGSYVTLKKGDVVVADASEDYQEIAIPSVLLDTDNQQIVAGLHTIAFRPKNELIPLFLYFTLTAPKFRHYGYQVGQGLKVFGISRSNVEKFDLDAPSRKEQEKIVGLLDLLDSTIALHQQEINRLQKLKQGYLQKMFV